MVRCGLGRTKVESGAMNGPLLVVAGPTASGKSALGLAVAAALGGEIVSADAFAVYRGMDIGTDKPDRVSRRRVRHHLIDILEPSEQFSAGDFVVAADAAIEETRSRGKVPVVVGGTHFYIRALVFGLFPGPPRDPEIRQRLLDEWNADPDTCWARLQAVDPSAARRIGPRDRQRCVRALEVYDLTGTPLTEHWRRHNPTPRYRPLIATPARERATLYAKIDKRVDTMFSEGLVEEVRRLLSSGVRSDTHALKAIGYREVVGHIEGQWGFDAAVDRTKRASRRLAKRQLAWLRHLREGELHRVEPVEAGGAEDLIHLWDSHCEEGGWK